MDLHSSEFTGEDDVQGKRAIVIGSNNSAHDICAALWDHGADVTMIQRSSTHTARSESLMSLALGPLYSEEALENGVTTEKADMLFASWPYRPLPTRRSPSTTRWRRRTPSSTRSCAASDSTWTSARTGRALFLKYLRRGSGYYIDVGASQLLIDGEVALERGQVTRIRPEASSSTVSACCPPTSSSTPPGTAR